jgi:glycosyltransferase involved in cell wall biosynthesis
MALALEKLCLDPALREKMGTAGCEHVKKKYDIKELNNKLSEILVNL